MNSQPIVGSEMETQVIKPEFLRIPCRGAFIVVRVDRFIQILPPEKGRQKWRVFIHGIDEPIEVSQEDAVQMTRELFPNDPVYYVSPEGNPEEGQDKFVDRPAVTVSGEWPKPSQPKAVMAGGQKAETVGGAEAPVVGPAASAAVVKAVVTNPPSAPVEDDCPDEPPAPQSSSADSLERTRSFLRGQSLTDGS